MSRPGSAMQQSGPQHPTSSAHQSTLSIIERCWTDMGLPEQERRVLRLALTPSHYPLYSSALTAVLAGTKSVTMANKARALHVRRMHALVQSILTRYAASGQEHLSPADTTALCRLYQSVQTHTAQVVNAVEDVRKHLSRPGVGGRIRGMTSDALSPQAETGAHIQGQREREREGDRQPAVSLLLGVLLRDPSCRTEAEREGGERSVSRGASRAGERGPSRAGEAPGGRRAASPTPLPHLRGSRPTESVDHPSTPSTAAGTGAPTRPARPTTPGGLKRQRTIDMFSRTSTMLGSANPLVYLTGALIDCAGVDKVLLSNREIKGALKGMVLNTQAPGPVCRCSERALTAGIERMPYSCIAHVLQDVAYAYSLDTRFVPAALLNDSWKVTQAEREQIASLGIAAACMHVLLGVSFDTDNVTPPVTVQAHRLLACLRRLGPYLSLPALLSKAMRHMVTNKGDSLKKAMVKVGARTVRVHPSMASAASVLMREPTSVLALTDEEKQLQADHRVLLSVPLPPFPLPALFYRGVGAVSTREDGHLDVLFTPDVLRTDGDDMGVYLERSMLVSLGLEEAEQRETEEGEGGKAEEEEEPPSPPPPPTPPTLPSRPQSAMGRPVITSKGDRGRPLTTVPEGAEGEGEGEEARPLSVVFDSVSDMLGGMSLGSQRQRDREREREQRMAGLAVGAKHKRGKAKRPADLPTINLDSD
ncbi:hypothetical protein KIPB_002548 [Kipferlia bialata]|uniref:Uncharacterized protein n=1 Tax=Kipferlia bialata TaxID=797122 RepID=A0A9K3GGC3_9EUKA|nr:hypothetical protein KIPB_002548 [Kipferlia bialata]|eukprot:g2548.t1